MFLVGGKLHVKIFELWDGRQMVFALIDKFYPGADGNNGYILPDQ